jgi:hypothetical protein
VQATDPESPGGAGQRSARSAAPRINKARSASDTQGLASRGLCANAAGSLTSAPWPVTKANGIFSASRRSAIARLYFANQPHIEQCKIRGAIGDHFERLGHVSRGPDHFHPEAENRVLEVERDDRIILDDQDIIRHAIGRRVPHLAAKGSKN